MANAPSKSELIGQALLVVGGGVVTPDLTVRYGECETYLAMAVNYVMTGNYWLESKAEGEKTINPLLLTVFENVPISYSETNFRHYADLPKNVVTLPKGRALEITTMCGKKCFPLGQGDDALEQFYGPYKNIISYQLEGQRRVWLYNKPKLVSTLRPKYIVHVNDLADTDEIILPSDGYVKVVELMVNFLRGEKMESKDYVENGKTNS
jgi:hypothetical protein